MVDGSAQYAIFAGMSDDPVATVRALKERLAIQAQRTARTQGPD